VHNLKHTFPGSDSFEKNYSQVGQDLLVLGLLNGKRNGLYLEIGIQFPEYISNTVLLERSFDWRGVSVDIVPQYVDDFKAVRKNHAEVHDARTVDYVELLHRAGITETDLDYASVDCEPPSNTLAALLQLPLDTHRFAVITFEHDIYSTNDTKVRTQSRNYLKSQGYELLISDISAEGTHMPFEDWWVHPELIPVEVRDRFRNVSEGAKSWPSQLLLS
jgi:hypothetical protein